MKKLILLTALAIGTMAQAHAERTEKTVNEGWRFKLEADKQYSIVNIPHTYNLDAYTTRDYYRGKAEYRKMLTIKDLDSSRSYFLRFDAVSKQAEVWVNGKQLANHSGGYSSFVVDITDVVKERNEIVVKVDNATQDVTPLWADFTFMGGIYRDVWVVSTPKQHIALNDHGSKGVFISTPAVNDSRAEMKIRTKVSNDSDKPASLIVRNVILDPDGKTLQTKDTKLKLKAKENATAICQPQAISNPRLWSPESPTLYKVVTSVIDAKTGKVLDEVTNKTGFRFFAFDGNKGFSLNGKPYKLRGVNRHQDQWPVGVALDDEAHRRDIRLMKDMGCNFIRIAHYPQDDAILEACDEMGLLAWEEIPIIDMVPDNAVYADNCEENMVEMIRQHYNHTSVIAWGYMNEILLTAPRPGTKEWPATKERTVKLAQRLEKRLKEEDPLRASVMAFHQMKEYNDIGLNLVDVSGWNLYSGWYGGDLFGFDRFCNEQHELYPDQPMIISEWGAGSDRRLHSLEPKAFDFSIEYQQKYIEHYLPFIEQKEWISGCAYWNFIDFNVAERQESMPRVNNKGMFYNDRTPKDVAYYFKAMWRGDIPVVHIATRDWAQRTGKADMAHTVKVYSNCQEVELTVNGKSYGKKRVDNCFATFQVQLPDGRSTLMASGTGDKGAAQDVATIDNTVISDTYDGGELAINVGSNCYYTSAVTHLTWLADQKYAQGKWGWIDGTQRSTTSEIFNTVDGPIYQTWAEDLTQYRIDAPKGTYEVELLVTDCSRPAKQGAYLLGRGDEDAQKDANRYTITICGKTVEPAFTPAEGGRYMQANRLRYIVNNTSDAIVIDLAPLSGKTMLAGIKVRKI